MPDQASPSVLRERALRALRRHADSPAARIHDGTIAASLLAVGGDADEKRVRALLDVYLGREPRYGRENPFRYRWSISALGEAGDATYDIGPEHEWFRPLEGELRARDPRRYARRVALPFVLATQLELWSRVGTAPATQILEESLTLAEDDIARAIQAMDPWADTLLLWQLSDRPGSFERLRGMLFALALRYGALANRTGGVLRGTYHPFFDVPLVSATAQLALGLWRFGVYPRLLPNQLAFLAAMARSGAWADGPQPPDVLTTLAAAEVLLRLDPTFDPSATVRFFAQRQEPDGWWRALDPEVPALTAAIADWLRRAELPYAEHFAWPQVAQWQRDYITRLPTMAFFAGLADAFANLGGTLGAADVEVAFCDLAGFGEFNSRYGQEAGDRALEAFAGAISHTGELVVRIGGDELFVIGRPTRTVGLERTLADFLDRWPEELRRRVAVDGDSVRPRIVLDRGTAGDLRALHGGLGRVIGELKEATPVVQGRGVLVWR